LVWSGMRNNPYAGGFLPHPDGGFPDPYAVQTNSDVIVGESLDGGKLPGVRFAEQPDRRSGGDCDPRPCRSVSGAVTSGTALVSIPRTTAARRRVAIGTPGCENVRVGCRGGTEKKFRYSCPGRRPVGGYTLSPRGSRS